MSGSVIILFPLSPKNQEWFFHILEIHQYLSGIVWSRCLSSLCFVDLQFPVQRLGPYTLCMRDKCSTRELHPVSQRICFYTPESITEISELLKWKGIYSLYAGLSQCVNMTVCQWDIHNVMFLCIIYHSQECILMR